MWVLLALLALAPLLLGCGPASNSQSAGDPDVTIIYRRSGGIMGTSQEWVIHMDGRIEAPGELQMHVDTKDIEAIMAQSSAIEPPTSTPEPAPCCDQFTYSITIVSGDQETSFTTSDGASAEGEHMAMFAAVEALINAADPLP